MFRLGWLQNGIGTDLSVFITMAFGAHSPSVTGPRSSWLWSPRPLPVAWTTSQTGSLQQLPRATVMLVALRSPTMGFRQTGSGSQDSQVLWWVICPDVELFTSL